MVAYLEPISRPQISRLRGVAVELDGGLAGGAGGLEEAGRSADGGAMRYRTTRLFQERFGLRPAGDLRPSKGSSSAAPRPSGCGCISSRRAICPRTLRIATEQMRVHRALALAGVASRRAAEAMVAEGRVSMNGAPAAVGQLVGPSDALEVDGRPVRGPEQMRAYLLNKAAGCLRRRTTRRAGARCSTTCPTTCASIRSAGSTSTPPGP